MLKRIISIALAVVMVMAMAAVAVSAAEVSDSSAGADVSNSAGADTSDSSTGAGNLIYFDTTGWKNFNSISCHVWVRGGDSFYAYGSKHEICKKVSGTKYSYDISQLDGGLKSGTDYCVLFYANSDAPQTYDMTFGTACIGDTAKMTGKMVENPVDSEKEAYEAVWTTNSSKYGPHLAISSIGNIVGSKLCPNESGAEVIGDWLPTYFNHTNFDVVNTLAKAFPKFQVKDIDAVYAYILAQKGDDSTFTDADFKTMQGQLEKAFAKAYPSEKKRTISNEKVKQYEKNLKNGQEIEDISNDSGSTGNSGSGSSSTNSSGSGADGQNDTIFFVLGGVMVVAAGAMFLSRKKRE